MYIFYIELSFKILHDSQALIEVLKLVLLFFFNDTATTEIYTLSLHDALPLWLAALAANKSYLTLHFLPVYMNKPDRKSTRLNSSHSTISYAVFCLKTKKKNLFDSFASYCLFVRHVLESSLSVI